MLSIYKVYIDGNLCESLVNTYLGHSKNPMMDRLCANIKPFIERKRCSEEGYGDYHVIQVTHAPVAKQVINLLCKEKTIQSSILEFLDEKAVQARYLLNKTFGDIRKLMCHR